MSKVKVTLTRPAESYTLLVECDYETIGLVELKKKAEAMIPAETPKYDLTMVSPLSDWRER
jgi:hypothetical protein